MLTNTKDQITSVQATLIVWNTIIGVGILMSPREVATKVGTPDGWISVLLGGFIALLAGYILARLSQRFPGQTFYQYSQIVVGKFLGKVHGFIFIIYYTFFAAYEVRGMGELIHMYLLQKTPIEVIIITFLIVVTYITVEGANPIARICEIFFPAIFTIILVLCVFNFGNFELDNVRPVLGDGVMPVLKGVQSTALSMGGFDVMLFFTAFMKEPNKAVKATLWGIGLIIPVYTLIVVVSFGVLTVDDIQTLTWPMVDLSKSIELPGGFFERFELLLLILWVITLYTTVICYYYVASLGLGQLFKKDYKKFVYGLLPVIYIIAMYPDNLNSVFKFGNYLGYSAMGIVGIMPSYFLIIAKIRRKGLGKN